MGIIVGSTVSIDYKIYDEGGNLIDASNGENYWTFVHGEGQMLKGVERALLGHQEGDELAVTVSPEDGYGLQDPALTSYAKKEQFEEIGELRTGMRIYTDVEDQRVLATVKEIKDDKVLLDMNHPYAGQVLKFEIKVIQVESNS